MFLDLSQKFVKLIGHISQSFLSDSSQSRIGLRLGDWTGHSITDSTWSWFGTKYLLQSFKMHLVSLKIEHYVESLKNARCHQIFDDSM